ncbi:MAG: hypothetical protein ACRYHQ_25180 [Janthinobacterium lividum]
MRRAKPPRLLREQGFALLLVLWALVALTLVMTHLLSAGRSEAQLAANLRASAQAEAVADGAVQDVLFHLVASRAAGEAMGSRQVWGASGTRTLRIGSGVAEVAIEDLSGTLNPNTAGRFLLGTLIALCGVPRVPATALAQAVLAWRGTTGASPDELAVPYRSADRSYAPLGLPLRSVEELGLVMGMTPPLLACLAPHLSLLQDGEPGTRSSDPMVAHAMALAVQAGAEQDAAPLPSTAVRVTATASVPGGRFVRRATARLEAADGAAFRITEWGSVDP